MSEPLFPSRLFYDALLRVLPRWLAERVEQGKTNAFRYVAVMILVLDAAADVLIQGLLARYPRYAPPSALPLIGQSRGLVKGLDETNSEFAEYLVTWLEIRKRAGQQLALAKAIQHYLGTVRIRVVNRAGTMVTLEEDGTSTTEFGVDWDWDSLSNPEKSGHWSEEWIIVYTPPWDRWGATISTMGDGAPLGEQTDLGLGHKVPRVAVDAIKGILADWKAARDRVNTVIFSYDETLFDPSSPSTMPDGYWGRWGKYDPSNPGRRIRSRSQLARYWAPNPYFIGGPQP